MSNISVMGREKNHPHRNLRRNNQKVGGEPLCSGVMETKKKECCNKGCLTFLTLSIKVGKDIVRDAYWI